METIGACGAVTAQSTDVVGNWKLISIATTTASGERNDSFFGPDPRGLLIYTPEGRMTVIITFSSRKQFSGPDPFASPPDEEAAGFTTFLAYGGRYSVTGDKVTHHVEVSSVEKWVNTDLTRIIRVEGDRMTLITPPMPFGGRTRTGELVWERLY